MRDSGNQMKNIDLNIDRAPRTEARLPEGNQQDTIAEPHAVVIDFSQASVNGGLSPQYTLTREKRPLRKRSPRHMSGLVLFDELNQCWRRFSLLGSQRHFAKVRVKRLGSNRLPAPKQARK